MATTSNVDLAGDNGAVVRRLRYPVRWIAGSIGVVIVALAPRWRCPVRRQKRWRPALSLARSLRRSTAPAWAEGRGSSRSSEASGCC